MTTGFAVRLRTIEPVHHLVGLAVRAERLGASAVLVGGEDTGRDVLVAVAAMAVATERVALLPVSTATSPVAARRAGPALASLDELSDHRVVGCFPTAALRGVDLGVPVAAVQRGRRAGRPDGVVGVVAEGDRPAADDDGWSLWSPAVVPDRVDGSGLAAVAFALERHDVEELAEVAARAADLGLGATVALVPSLS